MPQKYYDSAKAAEALGVSEDEVKQMVQRQQLRGYRDGADWKFKVEDIEQLARQRSAPPPAAPEEDESDVLLSEAELGSSDSGTSGTVIGGVETGQKEPAQSDLKLAEEPGPAQPAGPDEVDSKVTQFEELDLALEEDLTLEDSKVTPGEGPVEGDSAVELAAKELEDDDLVIGGSGAGSDITIGGDSGISLVDPADSGLSLEEPLAPAGGPEESLELGEDDMIGRDEAALADSPTELKTEDDFQLTPLEEVAEEEESESGSQVIALDVEEEAEEAPTMIAESPSDVGMGPMLEEDLGSGSGIEVGLGPEAEAAGLGPAPLGVQEGGFAQGAPPPQAAAATTEAPYTVWNIVSLSFCAVFLILVGMMMYDLLRNMWSWGGPYEVNSSIMDFILSLLP